MCAVAQISDVPMAHINGCDPLEEKCRHAWYRSLVALIGCKLLYFVGLISLIGM